MFVKLTRMSGRAACLLPGGRQPGQDWLGPSGALAHSSGGLGSCRGQGGGAGVSCARIWGGRDTLGPKSTRTVEAGKGEIGKFLQLMQLFWSLREHDGTGQNPMDPDMMESDRA